LQMNKTIDRNNVIEQLLKAAKIATIFVLASFVCFRIGQSIYAAANCYWPREYRDVANVWLTNEIIHGRNPYILKDNPMMQGVNVYTPVNSLIVAAVYFVTKCNIITIHYVLDLVYMIATAVIIGLIVYKKSKRAELGVLAFSIGWCCNYRWGYVSTVPDHLGMLIWVVIIAALTLREIDYKLCTMVAFFSVLIFYIKQYFVVCAIPVFIYFIYKKVRYGIVYAVECGVIGLSSLEIINHFCPLFSIYHLFFFATEKSSGNEGDMTLGYSLMQMGELFERYYYVFLIIIGFFIVCALKKRRIDIEFSLIAFIVLIPIMLYLGQTNGAFLSYHLQMWMPQTVVYSTICLFVIGENGDSSKKITEVFVPIIGMCIFVTIYLYAKVSGTDSTVRSNWDRAYGYITEAKESGEKILISDPTLGYEVICNENDDIYLSDNGHNYLHYDCYWTDEAENNYMAKLLRTLGLFDCYRGIKETAMLRNRAIESRIDSGYYDMIAILTQVEEERHLTEIGYHKMDTVKLVTGEQDIFDIDFWVKE